MQYPLDLGDLESFCVSPKRVCKIFWHPGLSRLHKAESRHLRLCKRVKVEVLNVAFGKATMML